MTPVNLGIDLGTTNSLIAKFDNGKVQVFKNPIGFKETLASVVAYRPERMLVGDKAREYLTKDPINVFGGFKRKMGTDEKYYVVNIDENTTPIELSAMVLQELKKFLPPSESAEAAVITIPASFDSMQSNATMKAGHMAGFKEVFLLQEPVAACLAFFNETEAKEDPNGYWLVYDFGGGTFDVALVKASEEELKIVDHEGNNFLGGLDFDYAIISKIIVPEIIKQTGIENFAEELSTKHGKYEALYHQVIYYAEEAKKELSQVTATSIEFMATIDDSTYDFFIPITREQLNIIFEPIINETIVLVKNLLEHNKLDASQIKKIVLVGGSTYVVQVREQLSQQIKIPLNYDIDPTTVVAKGAAYYAANKYYQSTAEPKEEVVDINAIDIPMLDNIAAPLADVDIMLSYNKSSRDVEEVLIINCQGEFEGKQYRIIRKDGGFDTGMTALKSKKTEFLSLLQSSSNIFKFEVYDNRGRMLSHLCQELQIAQGMFSIDGQPLPHDICVEVDDVENKITKLEAIFQKNTILPQKRTLYREISKTIKKGDSDSIVINIMEGDKNSRPSSNLTIGCIEIKGKDLKSDLIKGSDIEIQLHIDESRVLKTTVFLVMTQQEFKNVFSISEKHIILSRLQEQYTVLENELEETIQGFQYNNDDVWEIKANALLDDLRSVRERLFALKEGNKSDEKYIIAGKLTRISQEYDKLGGNERIAVLLEDYFHHKERVKEVIDGADFEKDGLQKQYIKIEQSESSFVNSRNVSVIENKFRQLNDLYWQALSNTTSFLVTRFIEYKAADKTAFTDYRAATSIMKMADEALQKERYPEFRRHIYSISALLVKFKFDSHQDFKGTGIG